eukprot:TRINITY_DN6646_c0_g1_i1.p1 TRINITY_DN6646_c0_g1~~TRINITY_DN6646_c0_g1_i1.p1  ORF type:complete len:585 (-),score=85.59 TRINITY_DN6646_c0_g1_i1:58-1812(-)
MIPDTFSSLTARLSTTEKTEEQEAEFQRETTLLKNAIRSDPTNPTLYINQADLLLRNDSYDEAIGLYEKALCLDPKNTQILKKIETAIEKANIPGTDPSLAYIKGVALLELGHYEEAHKYFRKAIEEARGNYKEAAYNEMITSYILEQQRQAAEMSQRHSLTAEIVGVTTHYEYAILSAKCYQDAANLPLPTNWEHVFTSDDIFDTDGISYSRDGFYARVFINHVNKEIVIAYQGTDSIKDALTGLHHTWDQIDRQYICAELFAGKVFEMIVEPSYPSYEVLFTGHSLGAAQAEFISLIYQKRAVTFESPGITLILQRYVKAGGAVLRFDDGYDHLITSYLTRPNMINIAREKVGNKIRLYPFLKTKTPFRGKGAKMVSGIIKFLKRFTDAFVDFSTSSQPDTPDKITDEVITFLALWETLFQETAHWHSIMNMCSALQPEYTHNLPVKKRRVIDWPTIDTFSMYYRVTEDCKNTEPDETKLGQINSISLQRARYQVAEYDHYVLHKTECPPDLVEFLIRYKESKSPFQHGLSDLDKRVLQEYLVTEEGFRITSGLLSYQFCDYCVKRLSQFKKLLEPRELMPV